MRPNQQNKNRSRGRNNNNNNNSGRKHSNPLSRNYESNGPDVKIRGNASHVAEKYVQLARDAQSSGDSVMAENYLQHAEHYFRLLSAAQGQMPVRQEQSNENSSDDDNDNDNDSDDNEDGNVRQPAVVAQTKTTENVAEPAAPQVQSADAGEGGAEPRGRSRRPRRRKFAEGESADSGNDPQPDVGELPAFLTGGAASAAE